MRKDGDQKVQHILYEGRVEVWVESGVDPDDAAVTNIILRDGPHDLGTDLGDWLRWMLGRGGANEHGRCRMAKQLRIVIDDLEPDPAMPERRDVEGDPPNGELANLIKSTAGVHKQATLSALTAMRDQWQQHYRRAIGSLRASFMSAAVYELLVAQAERAGELPPWTNYIGLQVVPAGARHPSLAGELLQLLLDTAEDAARESATVTEVDRETATVDWFEVDTDNQVALEAQTRQPLEVGDYVAKVTLPCRKEQP